MASKWLFALAALMAFLAPAGAKDWWGAKLADEPTQFIFGYGSLINSASRNSTAGAPTQAIPVRVSAAFGYIRTWSDRSASGFTALGLRKPGPGEKASTINGVLYAVDGNDMTRFDAREQGYARVEVPRDDIEAGAWQGLPQAGTIWVYVPLGPNGEAGVRLPAPDAQFPLLESPISTWSSRAASNTGRTLPANSSRQRPAGAITGSTIASSPAAHGCATRVRPLSTGS